MAVRGIRRGEGLVIALLIWLCSLAVIGLLVTPTFGASIAVTLALILLLVLLALCMALCTATTGAEWRSRSC